MGQPAPQTAAEAGFIAADIVSSTAVKSKPI